MITNIFYVEDKELSLPHTKKINNEQKEALTKRATQIKDALKAGLKHKIVFNIMRWLPELREEDAIGQHGGHGYSKSKSSLRGRKLYEEARRKFDKEESSRVLLQTVSRIHPTHDRQHRNRFTFHGDTHSVRTDDFADIPRLIETLHTIRDRISPP